MNMDTPSLVRNANARQRIRKHYLKEWLDENGVEPMKLLGLLNDQPEQDPDRPMDKSQVYRWLGGNVPHDPMLARIARALSIKDPETGEIDPKGIFRDPNADWITLKLKDRDPDEIKRARQILDAALPPKKKP